MSRTSQQLLDELIGEAARVAVTSSRFADHQADPAAFAEANRGQLLLLIVRYPKLRTALADQYADRLAGADPLLRQLTRADPVVASAAAAALADRKVLLPQPRSKKSEKPSSTADERRIARLRRDIEESRGARDRARGQRDWATRERDEARRQLDAALTDRDDALTVVESLRAQLSMARREVAALTADVAHAAGVLVEVAAPVDATPAIDVDPRETAQARVPVHPQDARLVAALDAGKVDRESFLQVMRALQMPWPPPSPQFSAATRDRELTVKPLGGGTEIGGSCLLVEVGDVRLLVDAGMRPRQPLDRSGPPLIGEVRGGRLDAVVVTHAHHDHAGYVPALVADHPGLAVYCTADTAALLPTMWADSVRVFDRRVARTPPGGPELPLAPYSQAEVDQAQRRLRPLGFGASAEIAAGITIELFPAGHILGAAGVVVTAGESRLTVTGDVSNQAQTTVPGLIVPQSAQGCGLLVIESTHCQRNTNREAEVEQFLATVQETVASGGRVLVPAFALGRAQEVALTLRRRLPDVPVLLDGLAKEVARIYEQQTEMRPDPLYIYGDQVREVPATQRGELIASFRRGVIITTSGMLTAGPAVQWARAVLPDPNAALLLVGYQDEESPGAALLALSKDSRAGFELNGARVEVNAQVSKAGLSAHADRRGLTSIVRTVGAEDVMLVHGFPAAQREFTEHLTRLGHRVVRTGRWQQRR